MLKQLDTLIGLAVVMSAVSLLITIATQVLSALLALRGKNLANALEALAARIDPQLDEKVAHELADWILTDDMISDSVFSMRKWPAFKWFSNTRLGVVWERASAIRASELIEILRKLGNEPTASGLPVPVAIRDSAKKLIGILETPTPETTTAVQALTAALPKLAEQKGLAVVAHFKAATDVALHNVEAWFNSAQDRAKQWFSMHMRMITVACAVAAAFGLQLDSFQLFQRISSDPEVRARLIAAAPALATQAQEGFDAASPFSQSTHSNAVAALASKWPAITNVALPGNVTSITQRDELVRGQLSNLFPTNEVEQVFSAYTNAAADLALGNVKDWSQRFGTINDQLSNTGIELIASPYPRTLSAWAGPRRHLLGLLASAALLSLGAPFWFNLLKTLTNLRPALAEQVDKNPKPGVMPES